MSGHEAISARQAILMDACRVTVQRGTFTTDSAWTPGPHGPLLYTRSVLPVHGIRRDFHLVVLYLG